MTMLIAPVAPALGARYRQHSTGRSWRVLRICDSGLIGLGEEYYGSDCERRGYVTDTELGAGYEALT